MKVMFAHSIKGCRPLGRTCGVLIPSPCVNTTPEPFHLKVRWSRLFRFFRRFPQINVGDDSARIPFVEHASRESRVALLPKGRLRQACLMQRDKVTDTDVGLCYLTLPSSSRRIFLGLRSLWVISFAWR